MKNKKEIIDGQTVALLVGTLLIVASFITFIICEGSCIA